MAKPQRRGRRERRCEQCDKSSFPSLSKALSSAATDEKQLYGYECPHGNGWHQTSHYQPMVGKDVVW